MDLLSELQKDPSLVPIYHSDNRYYIYMDDVKSYMEASCIFDPIIALNNIATIGASDMNPNNTFIVGAEEYSERLQEAGVLLELKAKQILDLNTFNAILRVYAKSMVNKLKKSDTNPTIAAYDSEIKKIEKTIDDIDNELELSDDEINKKKVETCIKLITRCAFNTAMSYAFSNGYRIAISAITEKKITADSLFEIVLSKLKSVSKIVALSSMKTAVIWAVRDYREILKEYREKAEYVLKVLKEGRSKYSNVDSL